MALSYLTLKRAQLGHDRAQSDKLAQYIGHIKQEIDDDRPPKMIGPKAKA